MPDRRRSTRLSSVPTTSGGGAKYEAGQRLKRAIHVARARKGITSDAALSADSGIAYDTLYNWYSGRTTPRGHELRKLSLFLGVAFSELQAVYDGVDPEPPPLQDAVRDLVDTLRDLVLELRYTRANTTTLNELAEALLRRQVTREEEARVGQALDELAIRSPHPRRTRDGT